jgi:hypothetical protein
MSWIRSRMTFANVVAVVALFIALGGTGYAALKLPKNSVGTKQLKNGAVTARKVKAHTLLARDFKRGQLPAGPQGPKGDKGDPGAITGTLPSGVTLKGRWGTELSNGSGGAQRIETAISFGVQLASAPTPHYIGVGAPIPPGCSGNVGAPGASPGNLCVFASFEANITPGSGTTFNATGNDGQADPFGAGVAGTATTAASTRFGGTWAVTAP